MSPDEINRLTVIDRKLQILLALEYRRLSGALPFSAVEFRSFSQTGVDGILLYLFSRIGVTNRRAVEICAGDGIESNTANLLVNHGWSGLLIDGDRAKIERGKQTFAAIASPHAARFVQAWVTRENINDLARGHGFEAEIDLLSLDIDGNDYWIWQALDCVQPRIVVLEYNASWSPERAVTIPYDPEFRLDVSRGTPYYCGASLAAFVKLGRDKGYRLVGSDSAGYNAFFVRSDLGGDLLPEVSTASCLDHWFNHDWGNLVWVEV